MGRHFLHEGKPEVERQEAFQVQLLLLSALEIICCLKLSFHCIYATNIPLQLSITMFRLMHKNNRHGCQALNAVCVPAMGQCNAKRYGEILGDCML